MPLTEKPTTEIIIEIPGTFTIGDAEYSRKIKVINLEYSPANKTVSTQAQIDFFDAKNNLVEDSKFIRSYGVMMTADNESFCDMQGIIIASIEEAANDPALLEGKNYMKQFDWFFMVANTSPIVLNEMIKQFYVRALTADRFK